MSRKYPTLRAIANCFDAHYVFGVTVLAANAGHADAANEAAVKIAGHAIPLAIPKASFMMALEAGTKSQVGEKLLVPFAAREEVNDAHFEALYPAELIASMPSGEQKLFSSRDATKRSWIADSVQGLQPLAFEGTTFASSCLYTHNRSEREDRKACFLADKQAAKKLSPNITRSHKTLDVGANGDHAFYISHVEIGVSMEHRLNTNSTLRKHSVASSQYRFVQPVDDGPLQKSGATSKDIATGAFGVVPCWSIGHDVGEVMDAAHQEAQNNTMPQRGVALRLDVDEAKKFEASIASLRKLNAFLTEEGKQDVEKHETEHILSFAALFQNANTIDAFVSNVVSIANASGRVDGLDAPVEGLATMQKDGADVEAGRLVMIHLRVPV